MDQSLEIYFKKERHALLEAALTLVSEGRFYSTSMNEIAYRANLAESTSQVFYQSKELLESDLADYVFQKVLGVFDDVECMKVDGQKQFFMLWKALFDFYMKNPGAMIYIDQENCSSVAASKHTINARLNSVIANQLSRLINRTTHSLETLAFLFNNNVVTAVKLSKRRLVPAAEILSIPQLLWLGFSESVKPPTIL